MEITWKDKWILFNYLRPNYFFVIFPTLIALSGLDSLQSGSSALCFFFLSFAIPFGVWQAAKFIRPVVNLKRISSTGCVDALIHDFHEGEMIGCDQMRMGDTFVLGYRTSTFIRYDDIRELYNWVLRDGFGQWRELRIKTTDGKERTICHHTTDKLSEAEMLEIYNFIHNKNPQVRWTSHPHPLHFKGDQE